MKIDLSEFREFADMRTKNGIELSKKALKIVEAFKDLLTDMNFERFVMVESFNYIRSGDEFEVTCAGDKKSQVIFIDGEVLYFKIKCKEMPWGGEWEVPDREDGFDISELSRREIVNLIPLFANGFKRLEEYVGKKLEEDEKSNEVADELLARIEATQT